jgi:hypothetical protein
MSVTVPDYHNTLMNQTMSLGNIDAIFIIWHGCCFLHIFFEGVIYKGISGSILKLFSHILTSNKQPIPQPRIIRLIPLD